ncbi:rhodanese/Cell cycle control phosphatasesuperfamily protein [Striga asiatica]|uniref:Rhodanese/Cell cycle control phosphatasesuperfamily protein n=1 Tax=Striga asiatica TaxID=4170 RepID=A0A5A7RHS5_STRAF|nr:rhodanese/Cell cycle control phosphatasesuperfamily protein [Striga asiatica]
MATRSLQFSPISAQPGPRQRSWNSLPGSARFPFATGPSFLTRKVRHNCTRMQVAEEEFEVKQMRDMAAARKRWEALVRDGKVKVLTPREAGYAVQLSNKTLLDVRPSTERKKAWVKGSDWIPIFDLDGGLDPGTLSRKITGFMMGTGKNSVSFTNLHKNSFSWSVHANHSLRRMVEWRPDIILRQVWQFLSKVEEKFPKDTDLIVACQKGLRSLAACELLHNAGYENLFLVQGGLEAAEDEDLERDGPQPFKLAGIGGLSEFLGWTDQQRALAAKEGWGFRLVFSARLIGLFLIADALFLGAQQVGHYLQDLRSH